MGKLTALKVQSLRTPGKFGDGDGLMLVVKPSLAKSWIVRVQHNDQRRDFGLGSANLVSLAEARERAAEARKLFKAGLDPSKQESDSKGLTGGLKTFREAASEAHVQFSASWKNEKHIDQWIKSLEEYAFPHLGNLDVNEIQARHVIMALQPIWLAKEETARRIKQRICGVLDWANAHGWRNTECPKQALLAGLARQKNRKGHHAALPYNEAPSFMGSLVTEEPVGRLALRFLILTAARSGEVRHADWAEVNFAQKIWRIPAARMKAGVEHIVPLSEPAIQILKTAHKLKGSNESNLVFPNASGRALSDTALRKLTREVASNITVHGFRSTFRDWAAEKTNYRDSVVETALAHVNRNKVEAAYRRTDFLERRRDLMADWAAYLLQEGG